MAKRLAGDGSTGFRSTDHRGEIDELLDRLNVTEPQTLEAMALMVSIDLLKAHDETGISLDDWVSARQLVEHLLGYPIMPNGV